MKGGIHIIGPPLRAGMIGSLIAARCGSSQVRVTVAVEQDLDFRSEVLARPDLFRFHDMIGLPVEQLPAEAIRRPVFAPRVETPSGGIMLPYHGFGKPRAGVDFHHYWLRASRLSVQPDLTLFSTSIALQHGVGRMSLSGALEYSVELGLVFDRQSYAKKLLGHAKRLGASISTTVPSADQQLEGLTIDASIDGRFSASAKVRGAQWIGNTIRVDPVDFAAGAEWHSLLAAANRLVSLAATDGASEAEAREFNRLSQCESERIADMVDLLTLADPRNTSRPGLLRKLEVFEACGRIPLEDYEVFSAHEWLAALHGRGASPRRYHPMADAMPEEALLEWIGAMAAEMAASLPGKSAAA